jgi:hypothetical protein
MAFPRGMQLEERKVSEEINDDRRRFLATAAASVAAPRPMGWWQRLPRFSDAILHPPVTFPVTILRALSNIGVLRVSI